MEMKAYVEGILRNWWLVGLILALSFWISGIIGNNQTSQYRASTSILLNGPTLVGMADPSGVVQLSIPNSYTSKIVDPAKIDFIIKHYPRLSRSALQKAIVVTTDKTQQILLITVTDISPDTAADIANYLAQQFVQEQTADLQRQLDYYQNWLQQTIPNLNNEINMLNLEIQQLTPPPAQQRYRTPIPATTQRTIDTDQFRLDTDEHTLYSYQQAATDIQNTRPLFANAYVILKPATSSGVPVSTALSPTTYKLLGLGTGLLIALCLIIAMEYFSPFVRHRGEIQRIVRLPVLAESPKLFTYQLKRLVQLRPLPFFGWGTASLKLACAAISTRAIRNKGYTVLLTSPGKKRSFAAILTTFLARNGHKTLFIDADFENPHPFRQMKLNGPCDLTTSKSELLSFIMKTAHPLLYVLPSTAMLAQNQHMTASKLLELLPELQNIFSIIIIDAPTLDHADTHMLATKVSETVLLVKKRRDSLKRLKMTRALLHELKLDAHCLLLA